jgi:hypothetical protein
MGTFYKELLWRKIFNRLIYCVLSELVDKIKGSNTKKKNQRRQNLMMMMITKSYSRPVGCMIAKSYSIPGE